MNRQRGIVKKDDIPSFLSDFIKRCGDGYGIISLGVFGSVARGEMRDDENSLHRRVDIIRVRDKMNLFLKKCIDEEAHLCLTNILFTRYFFKLMKRSTRSI